MADENEDLAEDSSDDFLQRDPVIGRKNHYGSRTLETAQTAAVGTR